VSDTPTIDGRKREEREAGTDTRPAREDAADAGGVCVSEICEQDYYDYARSQQSLTTPVSWARKHWGERSRDYVVGEWKLEQAQQAGPAE